MHVQIQGSFRIHTTCDVLPEVAHRNKTAKSKRQEVFSLSFPKRYIAKEKRERERAIGDQDVKVFHQKKLLQNLTIYVWFV